MTLPGKSIVILISGRGSNMQAIIDAVTDQQIDATIAAVISNVPDAVGLKKAQDAGLPTIEFDPVQFDDAQQFDTTLMETIDKLDPELIVLAGFMRILSDQFVEHYAGRIINIHPSLLPEFKGLHTHRRVLEAGNAKHGASVHFVTSELDGGPIIIQAEVPIKVDDSEQTLANRVLLQEHIIYPIVIQWFIEGRLSMANNRAYFDNQPIETPAKWIADQLVLPNQ